jgi:hypothetical protein
MTFKYLAGAAAALGMLVPAAALAVPLNAGGVFDEAAGAPLVLVRDGEEYSGANPHNRWSRWHDPYERGVYYGPRYRTFGYYRDAPAVGLGLSPYPYGYGYGYGPSFGIYVNP